VRRRDRHRAAGRAEARRLRRSPARRPPDLQYLARESAGLPGARLFDLISEDNAPSIVKIQMLIFTIFVVGVVMRFLCSDHASPHLSDGLIALLGLSSAVFVTGGTASGVTASEVKQEAEKLKGGGAARAVEDIRDLTADPTSERERQPASTRGTADYRELLRRYLNV
jgi:hypothetical protein